MIPEGSIPEGPSPEGPLVDERPRDGVLERRIERVFDLALAASAASWAVLGLVRVPDRPLPVRISLAVINGLVAILLATRRAPIRRGTVASVIAALPSMVLAGAAVRLADGSWPLVAEIVFALGAACTTLSLVVLGRSFAFLPSVRALVAKGPYGVIRHPAYASELVMMTACAIARPMPNALLLVATFVALHVRIRAEESLLASDPAYEAYRSRVRYRLVPGVY